MKLQAGWTPAQAFREPFSPPALLLSSSIFSDASTPMNQRLTQLFVPALLALAAAGHGMAASEAPQLPDWQVLEFEERAFWATAYSRLELLPTEEDEKFWEFRVSSSVRSERAHV